LTRAFKPEFELAGVLTLGQMDATSSTSPPAAPRPDSAEVAVATTGLTKRFGDNAALDGIDLRVPRGSAFGYLGPNGAGKTTLMRVLLGLTKADAGTASLLGHPVPSERGLALARVGAIVDEPRFFGHLSGRENLQTLAACRERAARDRVDAALERVGLAHRADDKVSKYSMGMRQRLGVAACLLGDPELLMLDEPMNGLDPAGMQDMRDLIRSFVDEGRTVILSSHLLDKVERTCDAVAIVDRGRVIRQGPIAELLAMTGATLEIDCAEPGRAASLLAGLVDPVAVLTETDGLRLELAEGAGRDLVAEVNRRLVDGGVAVWRLQVARVSLENWFLSVTSRLEDQQ
jgi:ABC-2 type transport system ATP-binding protein